MCISAPIIQVQTRSDCAIANSNGGHFYSRIMPVNLHFRYSLSYRVGDAEVIINPTNNWILGVWGKEGWKKDGWKRGVEKMDNLKVSGSDKSWHYPWGQQRNRRPSIAPRKHQKKDKILEFGLSYGNADLSQVPSAPCSKTRLCCGCTVFATGVLVAGAGV